MTQIPLESVISSTEFTELRFRPARKGEISWIASKPEGAELRIAHIGSGVSESHPLDPPIAAGRGFGGGAYDWMADGQSIVYAARDGSLVEYSIKERKARIVWSGIKTSLEGVAVLGDRVAVVSDQKVVKVVGLTSGGVRLIDDRPDFAFDPAWTALGLVWTAWNAPHMPWESSGIRMWNGGSSRWYVKPHHSQIQQVRALPRAGLGCVSDRDGFLNVSAIKGWLRGRVRPLVRDDREHGNPTWGMGQRSWVATESSVFHARNEDGFGRLMRHDLKRLTNKEVGKGVHYSMCTDGEIVGSLRNGARTPPQVVAYNIKSGERTIVASSADFSQWDAALVEPAVKYVDGICVRTYAAPESNGRTIVWIHGGPTDQWQVTWYPKFNYWISRGYTIVVPDHRGTTGHGRSFQNALLGHWGEFDSQDVVRVVKMLGLSASSTVLAGGSAGGFTALNVLADEPGLVAGAAVSYPVTDLKHLAETSHRFERHSVKSLVGSESNYSSRSPLTRSAVIARTPLLVMHGDNDPVVPLAQSQTLVESVKNAGGRVRFEVMSGEGHGFRAPENKMREYTSMESFFNEVLG